MSTIVVVDDDQVFSGLLDTVFELEGHVTERVFERDDILPTVRKVKPALVLMDVHISQGDTLGILRSLKADEVVGSIPVVMTSGMDRAEECLAAGAAEFILKPFRPSELLELLADLL